MPQWTLISKQHHAQTRFLPRDGYTHFAKQVVAPIILAELPRVLQHYVIGFITHGEKFQAVALLGLEQDKNLYLHPDGKWLGDYVPASLRGYPFSLAPNQDGQLALCIDSRHLTDNPDAGEALFTPEGQPSGEIAKQIEYQKQCHTNSLSTQEAVNTLQKAGLIKPWPLEISRGEGETPLKVTGFYFIDEQALNALDAETYHQLQGGPMALTHAQLFSMSQLSQLTERARYQVEEQKDDTENIFKDDDVIRFDNI